MRRFAVMGVVAMLLGACTSSDPPNEAVTDAASTPSPAASPVPSASPTSSPAPTEPPPVIDLTADDGDYRRVVEEVLRFRAWLFANPHRQDQISRIYDPDCPCHDGLVKRLRTYVDAGRRLEAEAVIHSLEVTREEELLVDVAFTWSVTGVVYEANEIVEEGEAGPVTETWTFLKWPSGIWRVVAQRET